MITRDKLEQRIAALEMAEKQRRDSMTTTAAVTDYIAPCYLPLHEDIKAEKHRFLQPSRRARLLQKLLRVAGDCGRRAKRPHRTEQRHCISTHRKHHAR